jgi:hypothetical protein
MTDAIHVGCVEHVDPNVDGAMNDLHRLVVVPLAVEFAHSHAAKAKGGYFDSSLAEFAHLHVEIL